eukprot:scaffold3808_cov112-Isochrysis_galbana.AAC.50
MGPMLDAVRLHGAPLAEREMAEAIDCCRAMDGGDERVLLALMRDHLEFWVSSPMDCLPSPLAIRLRDVKAQALNGPIRFGIGCTRADGPGAGRPILLMHLSLLDPSARWFDRSKLRCLLAWAVERALADTIVTNVQRGGADGPPPPAAAPPVGVATGRGTGTAGHAHQAEQLVFIVNLRSFGLRNFDQACVLELFSWMFKYYPSKMACCVLLHAPLGFSAAWRILKAFLPPKLHSLFVFVGGGASGVDRWVGPELLPAIQTAAPLCASPQTAKETLRRFSDTSIADLRRSRGIECSLPPASPPPPSPPQTGSDADLAPSPARSAPSTLGSGTCDAPASPVPRTSEPDLKGAGVRAILAKPVSARRAGSLPLGVMAAQRPARPSDLTAQYVDKLIRRAGRAHGGGDKGPPGGAHAQAAALLRAARVHAAAGEHLRACERIESAYLASADPSLLLDLALAHSALGRRTVADELYRRILHDPRAAHTDELVAIKVRPAPAQRDRREHAVWLGAQQRPSCSNARDSPVADDTLNAKTSLCSWVLGGGKRKGSGLRTA